MESKHGMGEGSGVATTPQAVRGPLPEEDPLWYKDAVIYQVHVRAFHDSDGDGVGDFRGLAEKLDYVKELGVTAIWLLPFYPSPLRDDGYDIADYTGVHPAYGTLADFRYFLREAHRHGLRVITELVLNHTSDQHPWFQRARRAPAGSPERDFYVWSQTHDRYREARIIFKDFEASNWTWDAVAGAYYWHRFYSHQPDLNYDNPRVFKAVTRALDFWLEMGVDGLRLDAVPYLYEREGTSCENLPATHAALKMLRRHVDRRFRGRMLLAEANQWPEDAVAYFGEGEGDECHMAFHFPLMPRMFMALRMEDRYPIIDILSQTPSIPAAAQWAIFLRNHDELTLEMVTDEERDYMYRVYAHDPQARINLGIRRRLAPLLGSDRRRVELMSALLFSLPGTPIVYYGDEIGMGDNIYLGDRNGVRTPMQWSSDRNAGFSRANPQRLFLPVIIDPGFSYEALNVQAQHDNPHSLLWWTRKLIGLRRRFRAFSRGTLEFLYPSNPKVLAFVRRHEQEAVLMVANLSRFSQFVELDLQAYRDLVPVEAFGQTEFPRVGDRPYFLTLAPHAFYWFTLEARAAVAEARVEAPAGRELPALSVAGAWEGVLRGRGRSALEEVLPEFLRSRRWFGGKARRIKSAELADAVPVPIGRRTVYVVLVRVEYVEGDPDTYVLSLAFTPGSRAAEVHSDVVIARLGAGGEQGLLHEAIHDRDFATALLDAVARRKRFKGAHGEIAATPTRAFRTARGEGPLEPAVLSAEQSNTSLLYGDRLFLKLVRRVEPGLNPDLEITGFLGEQGRFRHVAPLAGSLQYQPRRGEAMTLGVMQGSVPNEGDAWSFTLDGVGRYLERVAALPAEQRQAPIPEVGLLDLAEGEIPDLAHELIGTYLESARLLGQRTAEMHLALAAGDDPAFAPEPFNPFYQRALYQSLRNLTDGVFQLLRRGLKDVPEAARGDAERVVSLHGELLRRFRTIVERKVTALRVRVHGDFHLGQVLRTGRDFVIIDFEGEPALPLSTRRTKRSPLRDAAGMVRSFHYAAYQGLANLGARGGADAEELSRLRTWAHLWYLWASSAFLRSYLKTAAQGSFLPKGREELAAMLTIYLLEKAVYELRYELNNRPHWIGLPLSGILQLVETSR